MMVFAFTGSYLAVTYSLPYNYIFFCFQVLSLVTVAVSRNVNCPTRLLIHKRAGRAFSLPGEY